MFEREKTSPQGSAVRMRGRGLLRNSGLRLLIIKFIDSIILNLILIKASKYIYCSLVYLAMIFSLSVSEGFLYCFFFCFFTTERNAFDLFC